MLTSIETLTQDNILYMDEVKQLTSEKVILMHQLREIDLSDLNKARLANSHKKLNKQDLSNRKIFEPIGNKKVKKILLVTNVHVRDVASYMSKITHSHSILPIVQSGSNDMELITTALEMTRDFTSDDVIIFWSKRTSLNIINDLILKSQHTRIIVISQPYRFDERYMREYIQIIWNSQKLSTQEKSVMQNYLTATTNSDKKIMHLMDSTC